ncbi:MAG: substrate-binding periplasmic protein [Anaerolineae bacterium]
MRERRGELLAVLALLFMTVAAVWIFLPTIWVGETTWARIQREGVMRVGLDPSFPPFEYEVASARSPITIASVGFEPAASACKEGGSLVGYDVDLAHELGRRFGVRIQFVTVGFDSLYDGLMAGKYEAIISALPYDPRRTEDVAYSWVYFNAGQLLVVREGEMGIARVEDLAGKRVAVEWGSAGDVEGRRLARRIKLELVPRGTPQEALEALKEGAVEAAIVDAVSAYGFIASQGGVKIVGPPVADEPYVIAVRLDSPVLLKEINEALKGMREEGVFEQLQARWF